MKLSFRRMPLVVLLSTTALASNMVDLRIAQSRHAVTVEVILTNQDTLAGVQMSIDLGLRKLGLQVDSVSFAGSRCSHFDEQFNRVFPDQDKIFLFLVQSTYPDSDALPLFPGTGAIATIYLSWTGRFESNRHTFTNTRVQDAQRSYEFQLWNTRGEAVEATFNEVTITINR